MVKPIHEAYHALLPDRGCSTGGPSCLRCPLPVCVEDGEAVAELQRRVGAKEAARRLNVSERTLFRWKAEATDPPTMTLAEYAARSAFRKPEQEEPA